MSGDILSRIQILLDANTANFEQNLQNAQRTSVSTFDKIKSSAKVMGTAVAAGAASATVALAAMAWETANQAVELEKFALRANTTTQDFQKMAVGAQAYGIEQEKLSDMMKDFNEKMGELTTIGAGGGVDFFEQIAVKTEGSAAAAEKLILKMQKLSGPEALQLYVDKLEEAGVTQQQMSFYLESMASDMTDLIPLLINGGEGMKLYSDAAERAGLVMSDETIAQAKILKEQMYLLDLQMQGAKNQLMQAVIPAFVDIAQAFFGGSEQGIQFSGVAEGVAKVLKGVASVAIGAVTAIQLLGKALGGMAAIGGAIWNEMDWYEMNPIGLVKAAYEARAEISALTTEMKADMHSTIIGAAERLDGMWSGTSSGTAAQMAQLRGLSEAATGVNSGLGELTEKQNKAADSASKLAKRTSDSAKAYREQKREIEEAQRLIYEYGDELNRINMDLEKEIERINDAQYLKSDAKTRMIRDARELSNAKQKLFVAELEFEVTEHHLAEEEKLRKQLNIDKLRLESTKGLHKAELEEKKKALDAWYRLDIANIQEQKRLRANSAMAAWGGTYSDMTGQGEDHALSQQRFSRIDESQELFDAQMALADTAEEREAIWEAHHNRMRMIEQDYQVTSFQMQLSYGEQIAGSMSSMMANIAGEQSAAYKVMFAIEKGFAIAQSAMAIQQSIAKAMSLGFPQNIPVIAQAVMQGAQIVSSIQSIALSGMAHDGIDEVPEDGTWLLKKGERVIDDRTNKDLKESLKEKKAAGPIININNHTGAQVDARQNPDGSIDIDVIERQLAGRLGNPNSTLSKSLKQNTTAARRR